MTAFDKAFSFVLINEGGYSNDPDDGGGPTNLGVTAGTLNRAYKDGLVGHNDVKKLARGEAAEIYREYYWRAAKCHRTPEPLCVIHFDAAVNHGVGGAGKLLQRAINGCAPRAVAVDGAVGPKTLSALEQFAADDRDLLRLCDTYCDKRRELYLAIIKNNPVTKKYRDGWPARNERCRKYAESYFEPR